MKSVTNAIALIVLPIILSITSCVIIDETGTGKPLYGYEVGKTKGYQDGHGGLSRTPSRHEVSYSEADRTDFFRGYGDGCNEGIKPGVSAPVVEERPHGELKRHSTTMVVISKICPKIMNPFCELFLSSKSLKI